MGIVIGALAALTLPSRGFGGMGQHRQRAPATAGIEVTISVPGTEIKIDTGKLEDMAKKMEAGAEVG